MINKPIVIKLIERGIWIFEEIECKYYEDNAGRYWYEFIDGFKLNNKLTGPYINKNECYKEAFKYYKLEWIPF